MKDSFDLPSAALYFSYGVAGALAIFLFTTPYKSSPTISANPSPIEPLLVSKSLASVVTIETPISDNKESQGSGVVIREDGLIVTNAHVVSRTTSANRIRVILSNGVYLSGKLIKVDSDKDLALIDVGQKLPSIPMASNSPVEGDSIATIGTPRGKRNTVAQGNLIDLNSQGVGVYESSATIDHGSSGGALINNKGELIGINKAKYDGNNHAVTIPIDQVRSILP